MPKHQLNLISLQAIKIRDQESCVVSLSTLFYSFQKKFGKLHLMTKVFEIKFYKNIGLINIGIKSEFEIKIIDSKD